MARTLIAKTILMPKRTRLSYFYHPRINALILLVLSLFQLNHSLTLRSVNHSQTHLYFSEQKETAKLLVGEVHLKDEVKVESVGINRVVQR